MKRIILAFVFLVSCSGQDKDDPYKEFNKNALALNTSIDQNIIKPPAEAYKDITSSEFRNSISNFLENLKEPYYFVNYVISFEPENAIKTVFRFVANSMFGFLGFFDAGKDYGLEKSNTSYKDTLCHIGVPPGDYLILPVFGPNSTGYAIAEPISWFCDPVTYVIGFPYMVAKALVDIVNSRAQNRDIMDNMLNDSIDIYSMSKNMYRQKYMKKKENDVATFDNSSVPDQFTDSPILHNSDDE